MKKHPWLSCLIGAAVPLAVGGLAALLTQGSGDFYETLVQPPLSPPGWLVPVVWTVLYALIGIASAIVWRAQDCPGRGRALTVYAVQLAVNFFWPLFFFRLEAFGLSLVWLCLLLVLAGVCAWRFFRCRAAAGWLFVPYLLWLCFALYLSFGVWRLN